MVGHWWKLHRSTRHHHRRRPTFWCRRKRCRITHHRPNRRVFCTRATNNIHTMPNWLNTNRWPSSMSVHLPQHHRRDQAKCHCPYRRIINWWRRSAALSDRNHRSAICQLAIANPSTCIVQSGHVHIDTHRSLGIAVPLIITSSSFASGSSNHQTSIAFTTRTGVSTARNQSVCL